MNNRRNVSLQCLQTALKLMPTHFAFRLALSILWQFFLCSECQ